MIKIYLPNTPSTFVGGAKIYKVKKVMMSCGGGMGGSKWYEYIVDFPEHLYNAHIEVTDYKGNKMLLNTRYIVKATDSQVVAITTNSKNPYNFGIKTFYYETPVDDNVMLYEKFGETEKAEGIEWLGKTNFKEE